MPNYKVFNEDPDKLRSLVYSINANGYIPAVSDGSGHIYVKTIGSSNLPESLPYTAFGDLRVAYLVPQSGWNFAYNINSDMVTSSYSGSASISQSDGMAVLQTGTGSGSWGSVETNDVLRYVVGVGCLVRFTAIFTAGVASTKQVIGYGDDTDGFFFGYNGNSFGILRRQNGVENWTYQSAWNVDKMDGSGNSGITLDTSKGNVYSIQFQWLGFGGIEFNIENPVTAEIIVVHRIQYANANTVPSIYNPTLPISAKVQNSGTASNIVLKTASAMGFQEGITVYAMELTNSFNATKSLAAGTENAVFSLKDVASFQGKTNRVPIKLEFVSYAADGTKTVDFRLVKNATLGGTPAWNNISANTSVVQADTAGTTVSGGKTLLRWSISKTESGEFFIPASLLVSINPGDTLTIAGLSTAASNVSCSLTWNEQF